MTYLGQNNELGHLYITTKQKETFLADEKRTFDLSFRNVEKSPTYSAC